MSVMRKNVVWAGLLLVFVAGILRVMMTRAPISVSAPKPSARQGGEDKGNQTVEVMSTEKYQQVDLSEDVGPSMDYELNRRLLQRDIQDLSFIISNIYQQQKSQNKPHFLPILKDIAERISVMKFDFSNMSETDGHQSWREREGKALKDLVQHRLQVLQNPANCSSAKKLFCTLIRNCGFGCTFHYLVKCLISAYYMGRTLILGSKGWRYSPEGWEVIMKPISSCSDTGAKRTKWPGSDDDELIEIPFAISQHQPPFFPLSLPQDIADRIIRLHGDPGGWWIGQLAKFLFKMQPQVQNEIDSMMTKLKIQSPIVGLHIRQTPGDKVPVDTRPFSLEEYMVPVEDYFENLRVKQPVVDRQVYVVSDLPGAVAELRKRFRQYTFISNQQSSDLATVKLRYSLQSLKALVADIYILSQTDFVVTTFTSNIGRLVYELFQSRHVDASTYVYSLDCTYVLHEQKNRLQKARFPHNPRNNREMHMKVDDLIEELNKRGYHTGLSTGKNLRERKDGQFPIYKVREVYRTRKSTSYDKIDKTDL